MTESIHRSLLWIICGLVLMSWNVASGQGLIALRGARIETASKEGVIEGGTVLIRDGKIEAVGKDLPIPIAARIVDLHGSTILPGFVDPYYVVSVGSDAQPDETREVTFGGRTFRVPAAPAATPTVFTRIVDGFDPRSQKWLPTTRTGITNAQLVTSGFGESAMAQVNPELEGAFLTKQKSQLFLALANQTTSLQVLRSGLAVEKKAESTEGRPSPEAMAAMMRSRGGRGGRPGGPTPGEAPAGPPSPPRGTETKSPADPLWQAIRDGQQPLFVNANNAAAILYLTEALKDSPKAKVNLVADGANLFRTVESLDVERISVIMPPRIELVPNTRNRVNVAKMLNDKKVRLAFSLSLNQSDYRSSQDSPLFAVAMLVRAGLDRDVAIRALTSVPAEMLGIDKEVGTIEKGKLANLVVMDEDPFSGTAQITQVLVEGGPVYVK